MKFKKVIPIFITVSLLFTLLNRPSIAQSVKKPSTISKTGAIGKGKVIEVKDKRYLSIDLIRFYYGDEALKVAMARGDAIKDDDGSYYVDDGYYKVDEDGAKLLKYQISKNAKFYVCAYRLDNRDSTKLKQVSFQTFKKLVNSSNDYYKITTQNNYVIKVEQIFVP